MGEIISIVSGKGGVGKTTLCANLAFSMALDGKKVVCIDLDIGLKNLDLLLGAEARTIFDLSDVLEDRCPLDKAMVKHDEYLNLCMISAAHDYHTKVDKIRFRALCVTLCKSYDYVLIDAPAGLGEGFECAVYVADRTLVVATPDITSIRDAGRTASLIASQYNIPIRLVINRMRPSLVKKGYMENVDDMMDEIGLPLIGIIPEDEQVIVCTNRRKVLPLEKTISAGAFRNIADRLSGKEVPLLKILRK